MRLPLRLLLALALLLPQPHSLPPAPSFPSFVPRFAQATAHAEIVAMERMMANGVTLEELRRATL